MPTGTIKRLTDRGFGFIEVDGSNSEKDLFFHSNELQGVTFEELKEGDRLQFEIAAGQKGDNATNVTRADAPAAAPEEEAETEVATESKDDEVAEEPEATAKEE